MGWSIGPAPKPGPGPSWLEWTGKLGDVAETLEIARYQTGRRVRDAVLEARRRADAMMRLERELEMGR